LPQIFAGGALGHDPFGAGGTAVDCVGAGAAVVGGAEVVVGGAGAAVVGGAVVTVGFGAGGAVVVGGSVGVVVAVALGGGGVLGVVAPLLATVKVPRRLVVVPSDHVMTVLMLCDPSASFVVSYAVAEPSAAVPAKSNGGSVSVRTGGSVRRRLSR
jgi:hypothetical protein